MFKLLFAGSTSACFELENDRPYFAPETYTIYLDGKEAGRKDSNVFSLFGLKPGKEYTLGISLPKKAHGNNDGADQENSVIRELRFKTKEEDCALDVRSFGACGDGKTDDTTAIQTAIHCMPPGSRLYFPAGTYLTRPLFLKSHICLEFSEGSVLLGSTERESYPIVPGFVKNLDGDEVHFGGFEGLPITMYQSLLTAEYAEDITIIGPGTVDGNAQNSDFWTGFHEFPAARPRLFFFNRCKNINVHGLKAQNSPSWQFHPYYSEDLCFYDIHIHAPKDSPNTDALDPESCDRVNIIGCRFDVGDDCIAIKSGKIELGQKFNKPADHHVIRNCLMEFGHGAITLGSEIGAGVRNLSVSQCYFLGTDRGLRIKTRRGRGRNCVIDKVVFDNIRMENVLTPVVLNMWYNCCDPDRESEYVWSRDALPVDERTPRLGAFHFRNLECTGAEVAAAYVDGLPESPVDSVEFENVSVSFSDNARPGIPAMMNFAEKRCRLGFYMDNVRTLRFKNVKLKGVSGEKLIASHYEELEEEDFDVEG